jgi:hypothetical protein
LPYGEQADETVAQKFLGVIGPDHVVTQNIELATDAMLEAVIVREGILQSLTASTSTLETSKRTSE